MAAILSAILVIRCRTNPVFDVNERFMEAIHMKFGRNPIKITELELPRQLILIGGGHFVSHLSYRMSDKTLIRT